MTIPERLCFACSASFPPRSSPTFSTPCCGRSICASCLSANPRLARYDPCLACLGGVRAVASTGLGNVDGSVKDEHAFVLGDDEDEEEGEGDQAPVPLETNDADMAQTCSEATSDVPHIPVRYYIQRNDTLNGIALRFNLDGRELCQLNNLPPSTLSTTPHLLHTRVYLLLPSTSALTTAAPPPDETPRRARERATKRLQTLTKETDPQVARVYVALASMERESDDGECKGKVGPEAESLEAIAVGSYLDDTEWEEAERREGRNVAIPEFPYFRGKERNEKAKSSSWFSGWKLVGGSSAP